MSDCTLVTALYNLSPKSKLGGRGWNINTWKAPFKNIVNLGMPVVIYTHPDQHDKLEQLLKDWNVSQYEIILYDLDRFKYSDQIYLAKEKYNIQSTVENQRCAHLCHQKIYWLQEQSIRKPFGSDKHYWIDFGLFHHGLFPDSLGGMEKQIPVIDKNYWPENQKSMFNPTLGQKMYALSDNKFICIGNTSQRVNHIKHKDTRVMHIIGGFFGGSNQTNVQFADRFDKILSEYLNTGCYILEERVMSNVVSDSPDSCVVYTFDTWYHDAPAGPAIDRCAYELPKHHNKSFYKVFYVDFLGV